MDKAEQFVNQLLSDSDAINTPVDTLKPEDVELQLPEWFDEKKFNRGRQVFWDQCFPLSGTMVMGVIAILSVPSILRVLIGSRRSSSPFTAYKRYASTLLHTMSWLKYELKPGSISWKSLIEVRRRHLNASLNGKFSGSGIITQRDIALTLFGFMGFAIIKPDQFGLKQMERSDWDAYIFFWRVIGHMIGLKDSYNICRMNEDDTRRICRLLLERVFTPCLNNVPEYFEHMAHSMIEGLWCFYPTLETETILYWCRYLAEVPGYIYTETERINFQAKLKNYLKGKPLDTGIEATDLILKPGVEGLPTTPSRLLYLQDYDSIDTIPVYNRLRLHEKYKMSLNSIINSIYNTYLGRLFFNLSFYMAIFLLTYFPYLAFLKFGLFRSFTNIFKESPKDNTVPKPNAEYYKPRPPLPWYRELWAIIW